MPGILVTERSLDAGSLEVLREWAGGPLGLSPLGGLGFKIVSADTNKFSYNISGGGVSTIVSGTGVNLTYNADNIPVSGTISSLTYAFDKIGSGAGGPPTGNSVTITDLNSTVAEVLAPAYFSELLAGDNEVVVDRSFTDFRSTSTGIFTGSGDDTVTFDNEGLDFTLIRPVPGDVSVNLGDGNDHITLLNFGFNQSIILGNGADMVVQQSFTQLPPNAPARVVSDFNPAEDRIELEPFADGSRVWEIVDFNGDVVVRSVSATNPGDIRDTITLTGLNSSQVALGADGVVTGVQGPVGPVAPPVFGTEGADVLFGDPNANIINGLGGDDAIITFENDDVLLGGEGNDSLDGGSGNDQLFGENGNDQIFAGAGNDAVFGGFGDDLLVGDADGTTGVDGLFGEDGNDVAYGGLGNDFISGGNGDDVLFGETGADEILGGEGNDTILGGTENDQLFGENGDDVIDGGQGADVIFGGFGNDLIFGDDGNGVAGDGLFGEAGDDVIRGGSGNDFILGGLGNDVISGGAGADIVRLESGSGFDFWQDFENGVDLVDASFIQGGRGQVLIAATLDGTGTYIGFTDTQLILEGVDFNLIGEEDFIFDEADAA